MFIISGFLLLFGLSGEGQVNLPAFPGAEGHGKYVTGGRGGKIIEVTNLNNSGTGSLREAVEASGPRIVVFRVSGTIRLTSNLTIRNDSITIAGQSAPGDGICLRDYTVYVDADNVIIRFMRFRMGDEAKQENDALGGRFHKNIMIDHCSMSWSTDECVSFYGNENFTLQWSIISESLRNSVHEKGKHGYGGIWGGKNATFHHNLLAHHDSRNPRLGEFKGDTFAFTDLVDLRNNVIYNSGANTCYGAEAMNVNIVNCYYKPGPATRHPDRIIGIDKLLEPGYATTDTWGKFYIDGNVLETESAATSDNWTYGVYNQFNSKYGDVSQADKDSMRLTEPLDPGEVTTHSAEWAFEKVLDYAGACLVRDTIDLRVIHEARTGTVTYMDGGNGSSNGLIDTQSAVGGWPDLKSIPAPVDTDKDGMPDDWENINGLNPENPGDAWLTGVDSWYPNVEVYLYSLVNAITWNQNKEGPAGIQNMGIKPENPLKVYFDHSGGTLNISHTRFIEAVELYSPAGILLFQTCAGREEFQVQVPGLQKGIYIVRILDARNESYSRKFIL